MRLLILYHMEKQVRICMGHRIYVAVSRTAHQILVDSNPHLAMWATNIKSASPILICPICTIDGNIPAYLTPTGASVPACDSCNLIVCKLRGFVRQLAKHFFVYERPGR